MIGNVSFDFELHFELTNDCSDVIEKSVIQSLCKRGVLSALAAIGSKKKMISKVEYFTNVKQIIKEIVKSETIPVVETVAEVNMPIAEPLATAVTALPAGMTLYEQAALELKAKKLEQQEKFKAQELAQQEKLKIQELAAQEKLKIQELEVQEKLKAMDISVEMKKIEQTERLQYEEIAAKRELKQMEFTFCEKENNKNRNLVRETTSIQLQYHDNYFKAINLSVFGTPSNQYIGYDDIARNLIITKHSALNKLSSNDILNIKANLDSVVQEVHYVLNNKESVKPMVKLEDCNKLVNDLIESEVDATKLKMSYVLSDLSKYFTTIPTTVKSDTDRMVESFSDFLIKTKIEPTSFSTIKKKDYYRTPLNEAYVDNDKFFINCHVCDKNVELESSDTERLHDIPKSKNGNLSRENIKLGCANCNHAMSNKYSVGGFKLKMLMDELKLMFNDLNTTDKNELFEFVNDLFKDYLVDN